MELFRNPELEAAVLEAPLEYGPRMVYGDWLIAQGDPRGEWFALSAAVEAAPLDVRLRSAATENFNANGSLFLGDGVRLRPGSWFGWLGGFLDEARLQPFAGLDDADRAAAELFAHPHARFLRHVALGNFKSIDMIVSHLAAAELPLLETVTLIDAARRTRDRDIEIDQIARIPTLTRLGARGVGWSSTMPKLRELYLHVRPETWGLLPSTTPALEELTLDCRVHSPDPGQIAVLAGRLRLARLRVLYHDTPDAILRAFTPPPPGLELLDLSHCALTGDAAREVASWPVGVGFMALRTDVGDLAASQLAARGRKVAASTPVLSPSSELRDPGGESWWCYRGRTEGRSALIGVPDVGRELFDSAIRYLPAKDYDRELLDVCVSLPSERWHAWPWAAAACVRSWKYEHALCEAIAREGLMREPNEPNFYAFITYALRKQKLFAEAAAEVPRAAQAIAEPPKTPQETGPQLCLIDCMFTLAQNGDYAGAIEFYKKFTISDPNLQAALAICYAATGQVDEARAALAKAFVPENATLAAYITEPNRRAVYDHAVAAVVLLPASAQMVELAAANRRAALTPAKVAVLKQLAAANPGNAKLAELVATLDPAYERAATLSRRAALTPAKVAVLKKLAAANPDNTKLAELVAALDPAYLKQQDPVVETTIEPEPGSEPVVDVGNPIEALRPDLTDERRKTIAIEALTRTWTVYPEREWLRTCRTLEALKDDPRWVALQKT